MVKRNLDRIYVGYKAELVYGSKLIECVIDNISAAGVCIITGSTDSGIEFGKDDVLELRFEPCPGETINFNCQIIWLKQTPPHRLTTKIGLKIINPSWEQSNFFV